MSKKFNTKPLIVANWKMNPEKLSEAKRLFDLVKNKVKSMKKAEVVVCPPSIYIQHLISNIKIGAQNCFWERKGAFTGEVSAPMLKDIGCKYVIIGHSERRKYFSETDEMINRKVKAALKENLTPILCIGETEKERKEEKTDIVLKNQLEKDLLGISASKIARLVFAYEPVWAIGTGNACDAEEAQKSLLFIRKVVSQIYNQNISRKIRILYGGSVNSKNAGAFIKEAGFNGLLVGGASLEANEFSKIVKVAV